MFLKFISFRISIDSSLLKISKYKIKRLKLNYIPNKIKVKFSLCYKYCRVHLCSVWNFFFTFTVCSNLNCLKLKFLILRTQPVMLVWNVLLLFLDRKIYSTSGGEVLFTKMDQEAEMDIKVKIIIKCINRNTFPSVFSSVFFSSNY